MKYLGILAIKSQDLLLWHVINLPISMSANKCVCYTAMAGRIYFKPFFCCLDLDEMVPLMIFLNISPICFRLMHGASM